MSPLSPTLRKVFHGSLYGHPNAYGMFLHAGIEMLRPGGRLGFIVPRSMLSGLYFQNLRRMIEERTYIEELSLLAERKNVFPQVLRLEAACTRFRHLCRSGDRIPPGAVP